MTPEQKKATPAEQPAPRPEPETDLSFRVTEPLPYNFFPDITREPSGDALFLAVDRPLSAGERLHLSFITKTRRVESIAEVCWSHRSCPAPEAKVRLIEISPDDRDLIELYIREKK